MPMTIWRPNIGFMFAAKSFWAPKNVLKAVLQEKDPNEKYGHFPGHLLHKPCTRMTTLGCIQTPIVLVILYSDTYWSHSVFVIGAFLSGYLSAFEAGELVQNDA